MFLGMSTTTPTRPGLGLWFATILVTIGGLFSGLIGGFGLLAMLESPPVFDVASPPAESHYDAMRVKNGFCRFDELEEVKGSDDCVVPITADQAKIAKYSNVPLILMMSCADMADVFDAAAFTAREPAPCAPLGKSYTLDVHGDTFRDSMLARYPGFVGEVMELPNPEDAKEDFVIMLGLAGIGATAGLGGAYLLVLLWRRRKRAVAAEGA
jgi:hypothetical protein